MRRATRRSVTVLLALGVSGGLAAAARGGHVARGSAHTSVHRSANRNWNVNRNVNVNRNINRNIDVDRDWDVHRRYDIDYHHGCCYGGGWGTAAAVATTAAATAAVVGSRVYSLPPSCSLVIVGGFSYQQCGRTWYQPQISGSSTSYVVVNPPR
jgi:hypothetical protein